MRYICCDCDEIFDEEDAGTTWESRGEFWGMPCSERMMCCPRCRSVEIAEYEEEEEEDEE